MSEIRSRARISKQDGLSATGSKHNWFHPCQILRLTKGAQARLEAGASHSTHLVFFLGANSSDFARLCDNPYAPAGIPKARDVDKVLHVTSLVARSTGQV